jgi:uracil phosphoribosyltransferase
VVLAIVMLTRAAEQDGYIFPGLGDAGDRQFQTAMHPDTIPKKHKH